MLRKRVPDIRLLRASDARVALQMLDLEPYRPVSQMPAVKRDLSIMVLEEVTGEDIGDQVRLALGDRAGAVELIEIRSETPYSRLPPAAVARMGALPGQKNVLLRVVLRDLERTLTHSQANVLRDTIYRALHCGERLELAGA
jgi:phenylalanyl-tRNA synthetase alpha chain